ncbi:MAG: DegT/DnrJ/EryC1/StrS family aminotransferase [candidate division Zixibacteria bacterium]|nr:DegT/DnrJ/EryC1/StrS family aminotransferase [candidate division Zixibacteria bacterium]
MRAKSSKTRIPLFDLKVSAAAKKEVAKTLTSGWLTSGPRVAAFERAVAKLLGVRYSAAVSSATVGLQLALRAIDIGPGDEVVTTPFTFVATLEAIMATGARPVLADINPDTLNIDPDEIERKITGHTRALVPVDIAGYPADYEQLCAISGEFSIPVVSDSAHAVGSAYRNRSIPRLADASVFSFYSTKNLTCGEGGMVVSKHKTLAETVRCLARHGLTSQAWTRKTGSEQTYDAVSAGFKANMSDVHAAIGLGQLGTLASDQKLRELLAMRYLENLQDLPELVELPTIQRHYRHGWHLFIVRLHLSALKIDRDRFIHLMAARGIECGVHYRPIFELSYYRDALGLSPQYFPNSAYAGRRVVSLPLYPCLKAGEVDYVCECAAEILKKNAR